MAYADDFRFHPDPVLFYEVPEDGEYVVEIHDSIYRGREDFVYRITIGELPFVTGIFPLGGRAGTQVTVGLDGLEPARRDKLDAWTPSTSRGDPIRSISVPRAELDLQPRAVCRRHAAGMPRAGAERRRRRPPRRSRCRSSSTGGSTGRATATCSASRAAPASRSSPRSTPAGSDSPLDSLLKLTDAAGKQLAFNDDYEDKGAALITHHADSRISAAPARQRRPTTCTSAMRSARAGRSSPTACTFGPPRPDFELRVVPSSVIARAGTCVPITVYALRQTASTTTSPWSWKRPRRASG